MSVDCTFDESWSCGYSPSIDDVTGLADLWDVKSGHFDEGWLIRLLYIPIFYRLEMRRVFLRVSGTAHGLSKVSRRRRSPCDVTNPLHLDSSLHPPWLLPGRFLAAFHLSVCLGFTSCFCFAGDVTLHILLVNQSQVTQLCSLPFQDDLMAFIGWNSTDVMLTSYPGDYRIVFEAVALTESGARLQIDNITLLNENCTVDEEYGV